MISHQVERLAAGASWMHQRAPEAKIAAILLLLGAVLSEFHYAGARFAAYAVILLLLIMAARLPVTLFLRRAVVVAPILLLAAALPWISMRMGEAGVARIDPRLLLPKGLLAVFLLTWLAATTRFADLAAALERLRAPAIFRLLAGLMYRYVPLLQGEWNRMEIARRSRTPGEPRRRSLPLLARQLANLFLRAWQRADRVQAAMDARAFTGRWPRGAARPWRAVDTFFIALAAVAALAVRLSEVWLGWV